MHKAYKFLVAVCAIQMAASLLVLGTNPPCTLVLSSIQPTATSQDDVCHYYRRQRYNRSFAETDPNAQALQITFHTYHLEACVFLSSIFATSFAALYMQLYERMDITLDAPETLACLVTWAFSATQFAATLGLTQEGAIMAHDTFLLQLSAHLFGLLVACGTPPQMPLWTLAAMLIPTGQLIYAMTHACSQTGLVMLVMQLFMDILLFIGHRWDPVPTLECLQNSRLVYVTGCSYILQIAVIVLPRL